MRLAPFATLPALSALFTLFTLLAVGCGHAASRQECDEIFERTAAIELKSQRIPDAKEVEKRMTEARAAKATEFVDRCLGKKITDNAMACIRKADTDKQLDACLE